MIILRQKNYALLADGSGKSISEYKQQFNQAGGKDKLGMSFTDWYKGQGTGVAADNNKITQAATQRATQRKANQDFAKANPNAFKNVATKAKTQGYNAGVKAGKSQVGLKQGALNTWNGMSQNQKIATGVIGGAAVLGTGMMIARNRKKRKEAERELELERARNRR